MRETITIREYGVVSEGKFNLPYNSYSKEIDEESFESIVKYIEENNNEDHEKAFMIFRKRGRRHIRVKNYVGTIETKTKTSLEILPKIEDEQRKDLPQDKSKKILRRMLKSLKNSPYISLGQASLESENNFPIFEIFILNYLNELSVLINKGLKSEYITNEENIPYLKGKLLVKQNIKFNSILKSRFYCEYSSFNLNIPPNKLIKSCLNHFKRLTRSSKNKNLIIKLLSFFDEIDLSSDIKTDIKYCLNNKKTLTNYGNLISWSEVFLSNKSFTNFHGKHINQAILFPMEKLFESYVAYTLKKYGGSLEINAQDKKYSLVSQKKYENDLNYSVNKFNLKPDIVINSDQIIIDTKWKVISEFSNKFDIKEADVYQMHAYGKRYQEGNSSNRAPRLCLLYPKTSSFSEKLYQMRFGEDLLLDVIPFDLLNDPEEEIKKLLSTLTLN